LFRDRERLAEHGKPANRELAVKLHVGDLFIDAAPELDRLAECLEHDLRAAWSYSPMQVGPFERLLEELAVRGVTVDAARNKHRRVFVGLRLKGVWGFLVAARKLEAMGISKMVRSSP